MRVSTVIFTTSLIVTSLAVPLPRVVNARDLGDILDGIVGKIVPGATAKGLVNEIKGAIQNPELTAARIEVVKGLKDTGDALNEVSDQANATNNAQVQTLVGQAQAGLKNANDAVTRIGDALNSGQTPDKNDQKITAQGIRDAFVAISGMADAVTTPDETLSDDIQSAVDGVTELKNGGEGVLAASNISLADLGLPDDFLDGGDDANANSDANADGNADANSAAGNENDQANGAEEGDAAADAAEGDAADAVEGDAAADAAEGDAAADAAEGDATVDSVEGEATADSVEGDAATEEAGDSAGQDGAEAAESAQQNAGVGNADNAAEASKANIQ